MPHLDTADVRLAYEVFGTGEPVTVFGHGVASAVEDVRFLGSGVRGTKVFLSFRGHGGSGDADVDYRAVARDLRAVADATGATRAVGISMGAGAILRALADRPDRFDRCVLLLPPARTPERLAALAGQADLIERGDLAALADHLWAELPEDLRAVRGMRELIRARAGRQCRPGVARALRGLAGSGPPVPDLAALSGVTAACLVVAQEDDDIHPVDVAWEWAAALPDARLHVFARPWSMLRERAALRELVAGHLAAG